jgi:hypothetical protein
MPKHLVIIGMGHWNLFIWSNVVARGKWVKVGNNFIS